MFAVVMLMYALATTFWAVSVSSVIQAVGDPQRYALLDAHAISRKSQVLLVCQGLNFWLSDIIVSWRTWILWKDRPGARRVAGGVPCVLFICVVVCGLVDFAFDVKLDDVAPSHPAAGQLGYYNAPSPLYVSFSGKLSTVLSAALNVWCVMLAAIKSWQFRKLQKLAGRRPNSTRGEMVLALLALCGAIYCVFWIYWVTVSIRNLGPNLNATLLLSNNAAAVQINGIYPTFVIVSTSLQQVNTGDEPALSPSFQVARRHSETFASNSPLVHTTPRVTNALIA
ncbi:hypothetical protein PENSPDRAFT_733995 [Peniophora sp. CONT]|nr:hypothetical protein PENSPDRAFT_733995 [Peniophora sp. CONT]